MTTTTVSESRASSPSPLFEVSCTAETELTAEIQLVCEHRAPAQHSKMAHVSSLLIIEKYNWVEEKCEDGGQGPVGQATGGNRSARVK